MARLKALWSLVCGLWGPRDRRLALCAIGTLILLALGSALAATSPLALKNLIDALAQPVGSENTVGALVWIAPAALYVLLLCGSRLASDLRPLLSGIVEQRLQATLRQRFFDHVLNLPIAHVLQRRPGELIHSLDLAAAGVQSASTHLINSIAPALIELTIMVAILIGLGQPMLVALFAFTATMYVVLFATGAVRLRLRADEVSKASMAVYARLSEGVGNVETLRCFGAEGPARARTRAANDALEGHWLQYRKASTGVSVMASALFTASMAVCVGIAAMAVQEGHLTVGGFVLAGMYMLQMVRPLEILGSAANDVARAVAFVQPLVELMAIQPDCQDETSPDQTTARAAAPRAAPAVKVENLQFGYDPQRPVIKGVSLEIQAGATTAIVGRSGSGKSSLARLLLRLFSPQSGSITLDGTPIETMPAIELRSRIGLVPQDTTLLHASIAENIALGMPDATRAAIERAARGAQLHEVISELPLGYDTVVGERGLKLSGGERQRVAIARALLRRPQLFLLDEPTSMLDSKTEAGIQQTLRDATADCTTVVIAHRLSTVMAAHDIIVLDDGRVIEQGRHDELLAKGGLYAELWRQQIHGAA